MVAWLGAVEAQEYAQTKWGLGLRLPHLKDKGKWSYKTLDAVPNNVTVGEWFVLNLEQFPDGHEKITFGELYRLRREKQKRT